MRLTCPANWAESREGLVEGGEEIGELGELLWRQISEGGHFTGAYLHRADDRGAGDPLGDVGEFGAGAVVAVLTELVAGKAAGAGDDLLAGLVTRRDLHLDLRRRAAGGTEVG